MPRPRFQKLSAEKRAAILEAAGNEFAARGYEAASLNAILVDAGISKGAFYYYFDDKADLFGTVLRFAHDAVLGEAGFDPTVLDRAHYWDVLEVLTHRSMEYSVAHPWVLELVRTVHTLPSDSELQPLVTQIMSGLTQTVVQYLRRGQELGEVRTDLPEELLLRLVMAFDRASDTWFAERWQAYERGALDDIARTLLRMWRRMLQPEEGR